MSGLKGNKGDKVHLLCNGTNNVRKTPSYHYRHDDQFFRFIRETSVTVVSVEDEEKEYASFLVPVI